MAALIPAAEAIAILRAAGVRAAAADAVAQLAAFDAAAVAR